MARACSLTVIVHGKIYALHAKSSFFVFLKASFIELGECD